MKLTETMKQAIINAIMADVPSVDYVEQAQKLMTATAIELMPPAVKLFYERGFGEWVRMMTVRAPYLNDNALTADLSEVYHQFYWLRVPGINESVFKREHFEPLIPLARALAEQRKARGVLARQVFAQIKSCSTDTALTKRFPEFARYLPKVDEATANLPAETSLITNLMQLGWAPK